MYIDAFLLLAKLFGLILSAASIIGSGRLRRLENMIRLRLSKDSLHSSLQRIGPRTSKVVGLVYIYNLLYLYIAEPLLLGIALLIPLIILFLLLSNLAQSSGLLVEILSGIILFGSIAPFYLCLGLCLVSILVGLIVSIWNMIPHSEDAENFFQRWLDSRYIDLFVKFVRNLFQRSFIKPFVKFMKKFLVVVIMIPVVSPIIGSYLLSYFMLSLIKFFFWTGGYAIPYVLLRSVVIVRKFLELILRFLTFPYLWFDKQVNKRGLESTLVVIGLLLTATAEIIQFYLGR